MGRGELCILRRVRDSVSRGTAAVVIGNTWMRGATRAHVGDGYGSGVSVGVFVVLKFAHPH